MMLGPLCPKVKPEDLGEEGFKKWVEQKVAASDTEFPHENEHKINQGCWMASEFWYTYFKGVQRDKSEEVTEKMEKASNKPELMPAASSSDDIKVKINKLLVQGQRLSKSASKQLAALQKSMALGDLCLCWLKKGSDDDKRARFKAGLSEVMPHIPVTPIPEPGHPGPQKAGPRHRPNKTVCV